MIFETGIVVDVVLDESSKYFENAGGWNGIGSVYFKHVKGARYNTLNVAKPYFPNLSNIPLKNELIFIISLPEPEIQSNSFKSTYYYIAPINIWNSNHHNGIANLLTDSLEKQGTQRDYSETSIGAVKEESLKPDNIDLGDTFLEQSNIKPLKKYEGDVILESRVGSSIRFGTSVLKEGIPQNNWSKEGYNGQPITIIRNGQGDTGSVGFIPTEEDINKDASSIYLTQGQLIPLNLSSTRKYFSYKKPPIPVTTYKGNQIIINSDRVILNSRLDTILLSSKKSINLNAEESVNIDANNFTIGSAKIYLGDKEADQPVVLGDAMVTQLNALIQSLELLVTACASAANVPSLIAWSKVTQNQIQAVKNNLPKVLSKDVFTV